MSHQLNLSITTPCQENFNAFSKTTNGAFCDSCKQEVIDFTTMTTQEIAKYFNTSQNTNTCGRFYTSQLNQIEPKQPKSHFGFLAGIGLACLSLFSIGITQAQESIVKQSEIESNSATLQDDMLVKGTIVDENGLPLPGANILLKGTAIGTTTDFDGNFTFPKKLKQGDVLLVSYIGYNSKSVTVNTEDSVSNVALQINLSMDTILMGKVASKKVYKSKK